MFSYSRKAQNEHVEVLSPKIAVALAGTPNQVTRLLVSNENGLVSRFMFYCSDDRAGWRDVSPNGSTNLATHFEPLADRVCRIYSSLKDTNLEFDLTDDQWDFQNTIFRDKLAKADEDMDSAIKRLGLITFKIAMVLTILRNEGKLAAEGKLFCNTVDFRIALHLTEIYQKHADHVYTYLLVPKDKYVDTAKLKFLLLLPDGEFQRKDAVALGKQFSIAERTVGKYIGQLCDSGQLKQTRYATYCKV
jgi:hypothetical protein